MSQTDNMRSLLRVIIYYRDYAFMAKSILHTWKFNRDYASILKFYILYILSAACPYDKIHSLQMGSGFS